MFVSEDELQEALYQLKEASKDVATKFKLDLVQTSHPSSDEFSHSAKIEVEGVNVYMSYMLLHAMKEDPSLADVILTAVESYVEIKAIEQAKKASLSCMLGSKVAQA